jgi:hypothetical protein
MILERAAMYVLAIVFAFQAASPSWTITSQCWRSIDVRIGWLRVQASNCVHSICFEAPAGEKEEGVFSSQRRISLLRGRPRDPERLRICLNDSGCMTAWLDGISHCWSISSDREDNFDESLVGPDGQEKSTCRD